MCNTGTTGTAIANKILEALETYGLNIANLRGQGYDGAGNMAGKYRDAASVLQSKYPKAVYVHCAAHALNLCVVATCSVQLVKKHDGYYGRTLYLLLIFTQTPTSIGKQYSIGGLHKSKEISMSL